MQLVHKPGDYLVLPLPINSNINGITYIIIVNITVGLQSKCIDLDIRKAHLCFYESIKRDMSKPRGSVRDGNNVPELRH